MKPTKDNYQYIAKNSCIPHLLVLSLLMLATLYQLPDYWIFGWIFAICMFTAFDILGWQFIVKITDLEISTDHICDKIKSGEITNANTLPWKINLIPDKHKQVAITSYRIMQNMFMAIIIMVISFAWSWKGGLSFLFSWQFLVCDYGYYVFGNELLDKLPNKKAKLDWFSSWSLPALIVRKTIAIPKDGNGIEVIKYNTMCQFITITIIGLVIPIVWFILEKVL